MSTPNPLEEDDSPPFANLQVVEEETKKIREELGLDKEIFIPSFFHDHLPSSKKKDLSSDSVPVDKDHSKSDTVPGDYELVPTETSPEPMPEPKLLQQLLEITQAFPTTISTQIINGTASLAKQLPSALTQTSNAAHSIAHTVLLRFKALTIVDPGIELYGYGNKQRKR